MYRPDSLIFDMDGTLWDAIDSYCEVWNDTARRLGVARRVTYDDLRPLMGKPLDEIYDTLMGGSGADAPTFMQLLAEREAAMMPRLGGKLYSGVKDTLGELHRLGVRLFMVSNCSADGLHNFLTYTGLEELMTDTLSFGATGVDKDVNIRHLVGRYNLARPAYVGDVQRDADCSHAAGVPAIFAAYGFGHIADPDFTIHSFHDLLDLYGTEN